MSAEERAGPRGHCGLEHFTQRARRPWNTGGGEGRWLRSVEQQKPWRGPARGLPFLELEIPVGTIGRFIRVGKLEGATEREKPGDVMACGLREHPAGGFGSHVTSFSLSFLGCQFLPGLK